jgi:hypothetical protein
MRVAFAFLVLVAGCNSSGLPVGVGSINNPNNGGADSGTTATPDFAVAPPDLATPGPCQTACDCPSGEACVPGQTAGPGQCLSGIMAVYCCDDPACQGYCQARDGSFNMCGQMMGGMCQQVRCRSDGRCMQNGCGTCDQNTNTCNDPGN